MHRMWKKHREVVLRTLWGEQFRVWVLFTIGLMGLSACWVLTNPLMAAPDEPHHTTIAQAAARFQYSGDFTVPFVPQGDHACFAFMPDVPASCFNNNVWTTDEMALNLPTAGYPPFYYWIVGLPSLVFEGIFRPYSMRLWSALLMSCISAYGLVVLTKALRLKSTSVLALAILTPSTLFYYSSVNPSSMTIAGSFLAWTSAISIRSDGASYSRINATLGGLLLVSLARADAVLWVPILASLISVLVSPIELWRHLRVNRLGRSQIIVLIIVLLLHGFVWNTPKINAVLESATTGPSTSSLMNYMLGMIPSYLWHALARFGWLDTSLPGDFAQLVWMTFCALIFLGIFGEGRARIVAITSSVLFVVVPTMLVAIGQLGSYQGRYSFPLLGGMVGMSLLARRSTAGLYEPLNFGRSSLVALGGWFIVIHVVSIWTNWRRNAVGAAGPWFFWGRESWSAPAGLVTIVVLFAGSIVTIIAALRAVEKELPADVKSSSA